MPPPVHERFARIGLTPPGEVLAWYAWHDGSAGHTVLRGMEFYSIQEAIDDHRGQNVGDLTGQWEANWVSLIQASSWSRIAADFTRPGGESAPIRRVSFDMVYSPTTPSCRPSSPPFA